MNQPEECGIEEWINGTAQKRVLNFRPQNQAGQQRRGCRGTRYKDFSLSTRFLCNSNPQQRLRSVVSTRKPARWQHNRRAAADCAEADKSPTFLPFDLPVSENGEFRPHFMSVTSVRE